MLNHQKQTSASMDDCDAEEAFKDITHQIIARTKILNCVCLEPKARPFSVHKSGCGRTLPRVKEAGKR